MDNTLTFPSTAEIAVAEIPAVLPAPAPAQVKPSAAAQVWRTLILKWDLFAVIAFMVACGTYGIYAITQMTGF